MPFPTKTFPRIVYYGTPEFACAGFEALLAAGYPIVAAVTAPDKPAGRGLKLHQSELKQAALAHGIEVLQPERLKSPEFLQQLAALKPDLQVVVAFRKLPEEVWALPPLGTFNLHASLLPLYRGAAPINWAIINGETQTGVTTFFLSHEIDTGQIIFQQTASISDEDTAQTLHDRLKTLGAELILQTVEAIANGTAQPRPQPPAENPPKAPKIFKADCQIDFGKTSRQVYNFIRGLSPYPAAWFVLHGRQVKVFKAKIAAMPQTASNRIYTDGKTLQIATSDGAIEILELQMEGRARMSVADFLRGYKWPQ